MENKRREYLYPLLLAAIFAILYAFLYDKVGNPIWDCFREFYVPREVLAGKVLYKDVLCLYTPLGYLLNALVCSVFGTGLGVFRTIAVVLSLLSVGTIYFLMRKFFGLIPAFSAGLLQIFLCIFFMPPGIVTSNMLMPYSYGLSYAFLFALLSFSCSVAFAENKKTSLLSLAFLFSGLSFACKPDFILTSAVPFFFLVKNFSPKRFFSGLVLFALPLGVSLGTLFLQGLTLSDLQNQFKLWKAFSTSKMIADYNAQYLATSFNSAVFGKLAKTMILWTKYFIVGAIPCILAFFGVYKFKKLAPKALFLLAAAVSGIFAAKIISFDMLSNGFFFYALAPTVYLSVFTAIYIVFRKYFKQEQYSPKDLFFLGFCLFALLLAKRSICLLNGYNFGNWGGFAFSAVFVAGIGVLSDYFPKLRGKGVKTFAAAALTLILTSTLFAWANIAKFRTETVVSKYGKYNIFKNFEALNKAVEFAKQNVKPGETLVVAEEGTFINYMADVPSDDKYYSLIPHMLEMYGEERIVADFEKNPPTRFMITNNKYLENGCFGRDYGFKIMDFVNKNYDLEDILTSEIPNSLTVSVYRFKNPR